MYENCCFALNSPYAAIIQFSLSDTRLTEEKTELQTLAALPVRRFTTSLLYYTYIDTELSSFCQSPVRALENKK